MEITLTSPMPYSTPILVNNTNDVPIAFGAPLVTNGNTTIVMDDQKPIGFYTDVTAYLVRNPVTGLFEVPMYRYNPYVANPFYNQIDPINESREYQARVILYFYTKLTEKWLYRDPIFADLTKYFKTSNDKEKPVITFIKDFNKTSESNITDKEIKHVFKFIETLIINREWVKKVITRYIDRTKVKWYDLYSNSSIVKQLFHDKLEHEIKSVIYKLKIDAAA